MDPISTAVAHQDTISVSGLLVEFGEWLGRQRGLAPATVRNYCWNAEQFLVTLPQPVSMGLLDAGTVTAFMIAFCRDRNPNSAKSMGKSVRAFLRFAHATGRTSVELSAAVPSSAAVGHVVGSAARRAGLARIGAHQLRHTLATDMLRAGASLPEVGQVLRHRSARSTAIYAKVDEGALRPLARPWPGTAPRVAGSDPAVQVLVRPWPGGRS